MAKKKNTSKRHSNSNKQEAVQSTTGQQTITAKKQNYRPTHSWDDNQDEMFAQQRSGAVQFLKKMISKHSNILIIEGILFLLLSILMIAHPTQTMFVIIAALGVIVTVFGVYYLVRTLIQKNNDRSTVLDIIFSMINILLGIVLIVFPQLSFSVFITFLAIVFLVRGIYFFVMSIDLFRYDTSSGVIGIVVSLLSILLFAFVVFYPIAAAYAATFYIAISLIVYALTDFVLAWRAKRLQKVL